VDSRLRRTLVALAVIALLGALALHAALRALEPRANASRAGSAASPASR
jgi:hypothetical protein